MKKVYLRTMALACALGLAGCGGSGADLVLSINPIIGLTKDGMTIRNNGGTPIAIAGGTAFYNFTDRIGTDTAFNIEIVTQPPNAACVVNNGKGTTGAYAPTGISITCIATPHNVSAVVSGLTGTGLVVVNGAMQYKNITNGVYSFTVTAADGTKSGQVGDGNTYGFGILTQPSGQSCVLTNGAGIMGDHDVTNLTITCS
jgi:hypothetical protein